MHFKRKKSCKLYQVSEVIIILSQFRQVVSRGLSNAGSVNSRFDKVELQSMELHKGPGALFYILLFIGFAYSCNCSKIIFPGENEPKSSTESSVVSSTPEKDLPSGRDIGESSLSSYSIFPGETNSILENRSEDASNQLGVEENVVPEIKGYVRSMEITDSSEMYNPDRKLRDEDDWNRWKFEDEQKGWNTHPGEKTIALQLLDDDPYHHGRPAWPHDEYLLGYVDLKGTIQRNNGSTSDIESTNPTISPEELERFYEWRRLHPKPSPSAFIGPGFYDVSSLNPAPTSDYYRYHQPPYSAIATEGVGKVQTTGSSDGDGAIPEKTSDSTTNTRHFAGYFPYDSYKRKRVRLQIHPGLIAAPLAGLAAFGAASALTSKPLLVELGYVRNKPEVIGGAPGGGWGLVGTPVSGYRPYPPFYPPPNPPPVYPPFGVGTGSIGHGPIGGGGLGIGGGISHGAGSHGHGHGGGGPIYPILKPIRHKPESERSSWWNPFSGLTPRLVIE